MREKALELLRGGCSVIPVAADGTKRPALSSWEKFKSERRPTEEEVRAWFPEGETLGVAILMGEISGNMATIDFEKKEVYHEWARAVEACGLKDDLDECPVVDTPRGMHVIVRTPQPEKGRRLANELVEEEDRDGKKRKKRKVLIEVRGDGQYIVAAGSPPECHPLHIGWTLSWGPPPEEAPRITQETWEEFLRLARQFEEAPEESRRVTGIREVRKDDQRPGTDYCRRATLLDWRELLERHGWEMLREDRGGRQIWRRPDKQDPGGSATLGFCQTDLGDELYVFSTNAHPFEGERCYSIFAARALLDCGGDYERTAQQLVREGFGKVAPEEVREEVGGIIERVKSADDLGACIDGMEDRIDNWKAHKKFRDIWEGRRTDIGDPSEAVERYEICLLLFAYTKLGTPEHSGLLHGIQLLRLWRKKHDCDPDRAFDVDYMSRKVAWIQSNADQRDEGPLMTAHEESQAGDSQESRLQWVYERTGVRMEGLTQVGEHYEEAIVLLDLPGGRQVSLGNWDVVADPRKFERRLQAVRVAEEHGGDSYPLGDWPGTMPDASMNQIVWRAVVRVFHRLIRCQAMPVGEELELVEWAADYADNAGAFASDRQTPEEVMRALSINAPFLRDGHLYIHIDPFSQWLQTQHGIKQNRRSLGLLMKRLGFKPRIERPSLNGVRITRRYWAIGEAKLPRELDSGSITRTGKSEAPHDE